MWLLVLTLAAFAEPAPELAASLSARHADQDCAELVDQHGVDALIRAADEMTMPPWAPLRAAQCVGTVATEGGEPAIRRWLADAERPGLAAASVAGLERSLLPEGLHTAIQARLHDERFARTVRLEQSTHPPLRALVSP
ncbi:MAG: hypothetical protein KC912_16430 [Proteobacteria bacterium]|nr:hypothetical protein [Pseudomonadota bacterium]